MAAAPEAIADVLRLGQADVSAVTRLLGRYGLELTRVPDGESIPGSYWGESEAGLIGHRLYARADTPIHSVLHEACHYACMDDARRAVLHTDAGGEDLEEMAVCYLQILLADCVPGFGRERALADMDRWGYSFRLGSAAAWFRQDAGDAHGWLAAAGLVDAGRPVTGRSR